MGPRSPHWMCSQCGRTANWASRVKCTCGCWRPLREAQRAIGAHNFAGQRQRAEGPTQGRGGPPPWSREGAPAKGQQSATEKAALALLAKLASRVCDAEEKRELEALLPQEPAAKEQPKTSKALAQKVATLSGHLERNQEQRRNHADNIAELQEKTVQLDEANWEY